MRRGMLIAIALWSIGTLLYGAVTVSSKLSLPPSGDVYADSAGFQILQFVWFKVPALMLTLIAALAAQFALARIADSALGSTAKAVLRSTLWVGVSCTVLGALSFSADATTPFNPYFQRDEQLALQFATTRLPGYALVVGLVLTAEWQWFRRGAS